MSSDSEVEEIKQLVSKAKTVDLENKLHSLHRMKLSPAGLLVPKRREQIDELVSIIRSELERRREET